jgi:hypothetical protein
MIDTLVLRPSLHFTTLHPTITPGIAVTKNTQDPIIKLNPYLFLEIH